jgi:hypothetical protein
MTGAETMHDSFEYQADLGYLVFGYGRATEWAWRFAFSFPVASQLSS